MVLHVLQSANRFGWIGAFIAFVAFFWPARFFAVVPAMSARILMSEIVLQSAGRRVLESLSTDDRRRARTLFDLSIYSTRDINRLRILDAVMLTLGGIALCGGALWLRTTIASEWLAWALTVSGAMMAAAGAFSVAATWRVAHSGIKTTKELKELEKLRPLPVEQPSAAAMVLPVTFPRPRLGRAMLLSAFLVIVGVPTVLTATPEWVVVGVLCIAAAAWLVFRAMRSVTIIGPSGVQCVGAIRTREWPWDEIYKVHLVTARDSDKTQSLRMITRGGSDRTLVANAGRQGANPELVRLCDSINEYATAPSLGPTRRERAPRLIGLAVIAFVIVVLGLFAGGAIFGKGTTGMSATDVPAGRTYTYYQRADGSVSQAFIECSSLATRMSGNSDPLCAESFKSRAIAAGVLLVIELALVIWAVFIARTSLRLHRESKAARSVVLGTAPFHG